MKPPDPQTLVSPIPPSTLSHRGLAWYAGGRPEKRQRVRTRANTRPHYFDSRRRTTLLREQTPSQPKRSWAKGGVRLCENGLLSWDWHAAHQRTSQGAPTFPGLLDIVSEPMRHNRCPDRLNVFGQDHLASMHQSPSLRCMQQSEAGTRRQTCAVTLSGGIKQILQIIKQRGRGMHLPDGVLDFEQSCRAKHRF